MQSAPLVTRVHEMMNYSDNVLAESIAREVAIPRGLPPTFEGAARAVRDALSEHGFPLDGAVLSDSSGLSTDNRISPQHLSEVLNSAA
nr:D-alanyl-D-alanine carboxypeptidase [Escherichia coli]